MQKRLAKLHRIVVDALNEADALNKLGATSGEPLAMSDVGIGLDKARLALESLVWPSAAADQLSVH